MFSISRVVVTGTLIALNAGRPPPSKEPRRPALVVLGTHQHLLVTLGGVATLLTSCLEGVFCKLRPNGVLRSSRQASGGGIILVVTDKKECSRKLSGQ
jgi:hypothetical protein